MSNTFATGDLETDIIRKILLTVGGTYATGDSKFIMLRKTLTALGGSYATGDLENTLLRKIVAKVGGTPAPGDLPSALLRKWLQAIAPTWRIGDNPYDIYRKLLTAGAGGGGVTPCVPPLAPTNVTVGAITDSSISISWSQPLNIPPVATDTYEIKWGTTSGVYTDSAVIAGNLFTYNITGLTASTTYFFVVQGFAAAGCASPNSAEGSASTASGIDPVATGWAARVVINGGAAPSNATILAVSDFVKGCKTDATWAKIIAINIIAPDSLIASWTPLLKGPGSDPWVDLGGVFVNGDLSVNGLTGNAPTPKILKTGINPSTAFSSSTDAGWAVYDYNVTATGFNIGAYDGVKSFMGASKHSDNNAYGYNGAALANAVAVATSGNGYYADIRVSSTDHRLYFANSLNPHAQIGATDATASTGTLPNAGSEGCYVFAENFIGSGVQFPCSDTISAVAFFEGFTATDSANLFTRLQALRVAFGGGFR